MHDVRRIVACALALVLCSACSSWWVQNQPQSREKETKRKTPPPLHLGAVQQVYPAQKFALLRMIGPMPGPGTTLISHPADGSTSRIGNLMVAENSKPRNGMVVADIRSGNVVSGDRVFLYRDVAAPEQPKPNAATPNESEAEAPMAPQQQPLQIRTTGTTPLPSDAAPAQPTTPEPEPSPAESSPNKAPDFIPEPLSTPSATPDYINDIPNNINEWN